MTKKILLCILLIIVLIILDGYYINTKGFKVKDRTITINNIGESFNGFKIIQFSDLLLGSTKDTNDLENIVNKINSLNPDIVVFTGDLIYKDYIISDKEIIKVKELLSNINPKLNKYAVIGDNDLNNLDLYEDILKNSNFKILDDESTYIFYKDIKPIKLTGINNIDKISTSLNTDENLDTYYNIVITHYPDYFEKLSNEDINLVIAGHSLNGQIRVPFIGGILKKDKARKYIDDYYTNNDKIMYVSSGLGTDTIRFRLFNKPEINIYTIKKGL